jgi:hypothetical protein
MEEHFLQEFLKTGLFDIEDSDDRLKWLQQSISDLQKKFKENYSLLPSYTLVALDPNVSDIEPVMIDTESIITTYWKALRVRYPEMPRNIIRGVILNALNNIGTADPFAARIIFLKALNFFPYAKLNTEKNIIERMLVTLGEIAEKDAIQEWSLIEEEPKLKLGMLKVGNLNFTAIKLDPEKFKTKFSQALSNSPSGHGPQHGLNEPNYQQHFITKTTEAVSDTFNSAFEGINKSINSANFESSINKFFTEFKKSLDANLKISFSSLVAVERRSKLLWWKESLYSPSQKKSYRGIDKNLLPIIMSADLVSQVPQITPISVDFLLKETLFLLNEKQDSLTKFKNYLTEISKESLKSILKSYFFNMDETSSRISITDFISLLINDRVNIKDFKAKTGIDLNEEITFGELSVVVMHDLLTQRLITK